VSSPSRVRGGAPAAIAFSAYFRPQNASDSKKNIVKLRIVRKKCKFHFEKVVVTVTTTFKSGGEKSPSIVTYKVAPMLRTAIPVYSTLLYPVNIFITFHPSTTNVRLYGVSVIKTYLLTYYCIPSYNIVFSVLCSLCCTFTCTIL